MAIINNSQNSWKFLLSDLSVAEIVTYLKLKNSELTKEEKKELKISKNLLHEITFNLA